MRQLLAFARRTRLEPKGVDLSELINSFAELLETSIGEKADLHLSLQRRLPKVKVDPTHLEMALLNIVVKARDAPPEGGAITVTTRTIRLNGGAAARHLEPGDYVLLCVTDEGVGMPAHIAARATETFFTTKSVGQGAGLGLAMADGFTEQSGGKLEIESEPGRGTTIRMVFPKLAPEKEGLASGAKPAGYQPRAVANPTAPPLILVVEDNREIAEMAQEALTDIGYRVVARSAEQGLARFEEALSTDDPFKLVFSDVLMPGGANGIVLAEQVCARDSSMPVI